jgi:CubicO group peptidase (beta-lactamase class C family)
VPGRPQLSRRGLLGAGLVAAVAPFIGDPALACGATDPATLRFTPGRTLSPADRPVAYHRRLVDLLSRGLRPTPAHPGHPRYAGAVALTVVDGVITTHMAVGHALRYGPAGAELPPLERVAMRPASIFDLASLTKVFTALVALRLVEGGSLDLGTAVQDYLPEFRGGAKPAVTVRMLLAHTSGAPPGINVTRLPDVGARRAAIVAEPLWTRPGARFVYSDVNLMLLGLIVERIAGLPLDALVRTHITAPLGLADTGFNPRSTTDRGRLVATEHRPRGVVHDGNALALGGVAGHAGLFGTARDLAVVCQTLVNGGEYGGYRLLGEEAVRSMLTDVNRGLPSSDPGRLGRTSAHGLGVDLDQRWYMGRLASPITFGHTGFTGTSFVVDPARRAALVLLTNRVHPSSRWSVVTPTRREAGDVLANSLGPCRSTVTCSRHDDI